MKPLHSRKMFKGNIRSFTPHQNCDWNCACYYYEDVLRYERKNKVQFGEFGLIAREDGRIDEQQIESARRSLRKTLKKTGQIWFRVHPDIAVSKSPVESRQGKGKGPIDRRIARVRKGQLLFELQLIDSNLDLAEKALLAAGRRLPIAVDFVTR